MNWIMLTQVFMGLKTRVNVDNILYYYRDNNFSRIYFVNNLTLDVIEQPQKIDDLIADVMFKGGLAK